MTEAIILEMRNQALARSADFIVVDFPMVVQIDPDLSRRQAFRKQLGMDTLYYPNTRLRNFADQNCIPLLSLYGPLGDYAARNRVRVNGFRNTAPGDGHWNEIGHHVMADAMTEYVCGRIALSRKKGVPACD